MTSSSPQLHPDEHVIILGIPRGVSASDIQDHFEGMQGMQGKLDSVVFPFKYHDLDNCALLTYKSVADMDALFGRERADGTRIEMQFQDGTLQAIRSPMVRISPEYLKESAAPLSSSTDASTHHTHQAGSSPPEQPYYELNATSKTALEGVSGNFAVMNDSQKRGSSRCPSPQDYGRLDYITTFEKSLEDDIHANGNQTTALDNQPNVQQTTADDLLASKRVPSTQRKGLETSKCFYDAYLSKSKDESAHSYRADSGGNTMGEDVKFKEEAWRNHVSYTESEVKQPHVTTRNYNNCKSSIKIPGETNLKRSNTDISENEKAVTETVINPVSTNTQGISGSSSGDNGVPKFPINTPRNQSMCQTGSTHNTDENHIKMEAEDKTDENNEDNERHDIDQPPITKPNDMYPKLTTVTSSPFLCKNSEDLTDRKSLTNKTPNDDVSHTFPTASLDYDTTTAECAGTSSNKIFLHPDKTIENDAVSDKIPFASIDNPQENYPKPSTSSSFGATRHLKSPLIQLGNQCKESETITGSISENNEVMDAEDETNVLRADKDERNTDQRPVTKPVDNTTPTAEVPSNVSCKGSEDSVMGVCNYEMDLVIASEILNKKSPAFCDTASPLSTSNIQTKNEKDSQPGLQTVSKRNSSDKLENDRANNYEAVSDKILLVSINNTHDNYPTPSTDTSFGGSRHSTCPPVQPENQCTESETSENSDIMATEDTPKDNRSNNDNHDIDQPPVTNPIDNHHTPTSEIPSNIPCKGSEVLVTGVCTNETSLAIAPGVNSRTTAAAVNVTDGDIQAKDLSNSRPGTGQAGSEQNSTDNMKNDTAIKSADETSGNQVGADKGEEKCPHVIIKIGLSQSHETPTGNEVQFEKKETADVFDTKKSSEIAEIFLTETVSSIPVKSKAASSNKTHDYTPSMLSAHSAVGSSENHEVMEAEVETNGSRVHNAAHDTDQPTDIKPVDNHHILTSETSSDIASKDSEGPARGMSKDRSSLKIAVDVAQNKTTNNCQAATAAPSVTPAVHAPAITSTSIQNSDPDMDKVPGSRAIHTIKCNANVPEESAAGIKRNHEEIQTDKTNENENGGDKDNHRTEQPAPTRHSNFDSNISPDHPVDKKIQATGFGVIVMEINEHNNAITPGYTGISCQSKEGKYEKETSGMNETAAPQPFGEKTLPTEDGYSDVRTAKEVCQEANDKQSAKILRSKVHSDDQHSRANMTLQKPFKTFSRALHHVPNAEIPAEDLDIDKDKPKDKVGKSEDKESGKAAKSQIPPTSDDEGVAEDGKTGEIKTLKSMESSLRYQQAQSLSSSQGLPLDNASNKRNVFPPVEDSEKHDKRMAERFGIIGDPGKGNDPSCNDSLPPSHKSDTNKETKTDDVEYASGEDPSEITGAEMNGMTASGVLERPASDNGGKTQLANLPNTGHGSAKSPYGVNAASSRLEDFSEEELQRQIISGTCMKIEYLAAKATSNQKEATETFTGLNSDLLLYIYLIHSDGIENILKGGTSVVWQVYANQSTGTIVLTARDQATLDAAAEEFIQIYQKCFEYVSIVAIPISKKCCDKIIHSRQDPMHDVNKFMSKYKNTYVHVDWNGIKLMTQGDRCSTMVKEFELTELLNIPSLDWQPIKRNKHPADGDKSGDMPKSPSTSGSLTQQPQFRTKEGLMISIYKADITTVEVDAIVNAANEYLQHGRGVARAIADAAGTHFESECQETLKRHGGLRTSEVLVTSTGGPESRLKCKKVFHTVGPRRQQYNDDTICYRKLREAVFNCLMKAHDYRMKSIAIPAISSGIFGVSIQICSNAMFDAVTDFSRQIGPKTTLQHVLLIDFNSDVLGLLMNAFALGRIESGGTLSKAEINPVNDMTRNDKKFEESTTPESVPCAICFDEPTNPMALSKCNHIFCKECIDNCFKLHKPACPTCGTLYGTLTGNMPKGTMSVSKEWAPLPGHGGFATIVITYIFSGGIQQDDHPNPGRHYRGTTRVAYLPDSPEGRKVLNLLQKAFDKRLTFTIGRSTTTGLEDQITWNDIHHKTNKHGGPTGFGYPDPDYLRRVQEELKVKGIE